MATEETVAVARPLSRHSLARRKTTVRATPPLPDTSSDTTAAAGHHNLNHRLADGFMKTSTTSALRVEET